MKKMPAHFQASLDFQKERTQAAEEKFQEANRDFLDEMDGKGSGLVGYQNIAKRKEILQQTAYADWQKEKEALDILRMEITTAMEKTAATKADKSKAGIMEKVVDLHHYAMSDRYNMGSYILIFLALLIFEIMPVLFKIWGGTSAFEQMLLHEEAIRMEEMEALRNRKKRYNEAVRELGPENVVNIQRLAG